MKSRRVQCPVVSGLLVAVVQTAVAATEDLGNGFLHHGVATPASNRCGTVAAADGQGRNGLRDIAVMDGRIEAVWNQADPRRPWPGREPRLVAYPNPLFLKCGSPVTFVHYYYRGGTKLRIEDAAGRMVREIGDFQGLLDWDLKDADGKQVSPGKYLAVTLDKDGEVARCNFGIR